MIVAGQSASKIKSVNSHTAYQTKSGGEGEVCGRLGVETDSSLLSSRCPIIIKKKQYNGIPM